MKKFIVSIDQGTTSTKVVLYNKNFQVVDTLQKEFRQFFPKNGWVEHDPNEIVDSAIGVSEQAITRSGLAPNDIAAIGIANQRETTIVWERATGRPLANGIVWQDRRTADKCADIAQSIRAREIRQTTGLVIDAYFSATKLSWLLDAVPNGRKRAESGELCFGTVDSCLLYTSDAADE